MRGGRTLDPSRQDPDRGRRIPPVSESPFDAAPLCCLVGPTASGKTALALDVAERLGMEVLSLDSMQVYRGMDVGTAKASTRERARVPHHLLDLVDPRERFDVQAWLAAAERALGDVLARGRRGLFVGGTGFYLAALVRGLFDGPPVDLAVRARVEARAAELGAEALHGELVRRDPASAERVHPNDVRRVVRALEVLEQTGRPLSAWQQEWSAAPSPRQRGARIVGLEVPVEVLDQRIRERTREMLHAGWPEEAQRLRDAGGLGESAVQALGYAEALAVAEGRLTLDEAAAEIALRTRQFARRQRTWYRKFDVVPVHFDASDRVDRSTAAFTQ